MSCQRGGLPLGRATSHICVYRHISLRLWGGQWLAHMSLHINVMELYRRWFNILPCCQRIITFLFVHATKQQQRTWIAMGKCPELIHIARQLLHYAQIQLLSIWVLYIPRELNTERVTVISFHSLDFHIYRAGFTAAFQPKGEGVSPCSSDSLIVWCVVREDWDCIFPKYTLSHYCVRVNTNIGL